MVFLNGILSAVCTHFQRIKMAHNPQKMSGKPVFYIGIPMTIIKVTVIHEVIGIKNNAVFFTGFSSGIPLEKPVCLFV